MIRENEKYNLHKSLAPFLTESILKEVESADISKLCEIRIRRDRNMSLTVGKENVICQTVVSAKEFESIIYRMCRGSVHAFGDQVMNGYIPLPGGYRAGVSGTAVSEKGRICAIKEISSVNIRIPRSIKGASRKLIDHFAESKYCLSTLIFSPPGVGKTTLLSDLALMLSSPPILRRVALVDCRNELFRANDFV